MTYTVDKCKSWTWASGEFVTIGRAEFEKILSDGVTRRVITVEKIRPKKNRTYGIRMEKRYGTTTPKLWPKNSELLNKRTGKVQKPWTHFYTLKESFFDPTKPGISGYNSGDMVDYNPDSWKRLGVPFLKKNGFKKVVK